jgi:hypothetical protein
VHLADFDVANVSCSRVFDSTVQIPHRIRVAATTVRIQVLEIAMRNLDQHVICRSQVIQDITT